MKLTAKRLNFPWLAALFVLFALSAFGAGTEPEVATTATTKALDSTGLAWGIARMMGALAIVFAVFFAGIWLIRNGQRALGKRGIVSKLQVVEAKSLGARQTIYVIGYEKQRMLIASSPNGISFLSALPPAENDPATPEVPQVSFSEILRKALNTK